jgi:hypothetical protein
MPQIEITTKPNGAGRNWLEVGNFETDELGRKEWKKRNVPHQDRRLKADRRYSDRGETIDWVLLVPDEYPLTLVKVNYDRLKPREIEVIWTPEGGIPQPEPSRDDKIKRAFELAAGNEELTNLLKALLAP